jgi:stearoyl-CoA desaturase (delta-9 desaturase)
MAALSGMTRVSDPSAADGPAARDRTVFSSPYFYRLQRRHFILFDVLPAAGVVVAIVLVAFHPVGAVAFGLFFTMWLLTGLGLSVGYHRLFAHGAFVAGRRLSLALLVLGSMAARGPMISWVAMHRRHHERSDRPGDPHSPNLHRTRLRGWVHAHLTWMLHHDYPNAVHYVPDLLGDEALVNADRHYHGWVLLGLALPAALGGVLTGSWWGVLTGFLWGGAVRIFVVEQSYSAINSLFHRFGTRPFATRGDNSRNLAPFALLTWGEAWHNNHHAFPDSPAFGFGWRQPDPGLWLIRVLAACGLARDLRLPSRERIAQRRQRLGAAADPGSRQKPQ